MESANNIYQWFCRNLDFVEFIYALTFFLTGVIILIQAKKESAFRLTNVLWLFVAYLMIHSAGDFLSMWLDIKGGYDFLYISSSVLIYVAYLFIYEFGRRLLKISRPGLPFLKPYIMPLAAVAIIIISDYQSDFWTALDVLAGNIIRFPSGIMAGAGLLLYYRYDREALEPIHVRKHFITAGITLIVWGCLCGLVRERSDILISNYINNISFFDTLKFPVYIFRTICAIIVAFSFNGIIRIFNWETREKIRNALLREKEILIQANNELDSKVNERTRELAEICTNLESEVHRRKSAEQELLSAHSFLQSIIDGVADSIMVIDSDYTVRLMNKSARMAYLAPDNITHVPCFQISHREERPCTGREHVCPLESVKKSLRTVTLEHRHIAQDGKESFVEILASPFYDRRGGFSGIIEVMRDITERKRLENEIISISEQERQRIGQELHDDVAQSLMTITVLSKMLAGRLTAESHPEASAAGEIVSIINQAAEKTRNLAAGLCPTSLEPEGFAVALNKMISGIEKYFNIKCDLQISENLKISNGLTAIQLYRIAQEAINNAVKHSMAANIFIILKKLNGKISLVVEDNGIGIPDNLDPDKGLGLRIMRHRANLVGASLNIKKSNIKGTSVSCLFNN